MQQSNGKQNWAGLALMSIGALGMVSGIAMSLYAILYLRPHIASLTNELVETARKADHVLDLMGGEGHVLNASLGVLETTGKAAALLPETLIRLKGVLQQGSNASVATGKAANEAKKGVAGLVMPKKEVAQSSNALKNTATQMLLLSDVVDKWSDIAVPLAAEANVLSAGISKVRNEKGTDPAVVNTAKSQIQALQSALTYSGIPTQVMLLALTLAGLYFVIGLLSFTVGVSLRRA